MNCRDVRDRLVREASAAKSDAELARHVEDCPACGAFATRLHAARQTLQDHHARLEPDAAFATRVVARLPQDSAQLLGWAALRILPATVAIVLVLAWIAFRALPEVPVETAQAPTDDLLTWVVEQKGDAP
jgi:hypothetical protein